MKSIELLSPVGDFECLKAAVQNGANSVYFGSSLFNARAYASNFELDHLSEVIQYAKIRNVRTHLTLNTLLKDEELPQAISLAQKAYECGIDAIIIQDLGLAYLLRQLLPDLPLHASTQMSIHNLNGALELEQLGFKRVVLSRELSLSEITYIAQHTNIEIETFIHGALCMSYSGQCLFSSMIGGRSGNRGKCAQPCRLPYELIQKDPNSDTFHSIDKGYLLSPKDLCGLELIPNLIHAGVDCFKIEGRMKSPEYVATVTRIYQKYIQLAQNNLPYQIEDRDRKELLQVFNRGGFSFGHLKDSPNHELVYPTKPNHMGIYLGNISNYQPQKGHVSLKLLHPIEIGDTISFQKENAKYTISELMQNSHNISLGTIGQKVTLGRMKGNIHIGDQVYKMSSKDLNKKAKSSYSVEHIKIPLKGIIHIQEHKPICFEVFSLSNTNDLYQNIEISISSNVIPEKAKTSPITKERIIHQLSKTSNTPYEFKEIITDLGDQLFLPNFSILNELRRNALERVDQFICSRIAKKTQSISLPVSVSLPYLGAEKNISIYLENINPSFDYIKLKNINRIYIPLRYFSNPEYTNLLQELSMNFSLYIVLPTILKPNYRNLTNRMIEKAIAEYNIKGFVISNISGISFLQEIQSLYPNRFKFISNYTLNIWNKETALFLKSTGISTVTISPELNHSALADLSESIGDFSELIIYGKIPVMNTNYCFLGKSNQCYPKCKQYCKNKSSNYYLKDRLGLEFRVIPDPIQTVSTIFNSKTLSISSDLFKVKSYRINILDETIEEIEDIIQAILNGTKIEGKNYTNGNLNRGL